MFRAVLDANVYISAAIRPEGPPGQIIERFLRDSAFELVVSPAIVDEVLRGLRYPKVTKPAQRSSLKRGSSGLCCWPISSRATTS